MAVATLTLGAPRAAARFCLDCSSIDGGGHTFSTGGGFALGETSGQADAGAMSGGSFALTGGFWTAATTPRVSDVTGDRVLGHRDLTTFLAAFRACS